jgi:serine/threonine protein phosphatase PrpC
MHTHSSHSMLPFDSHSGWCDIQGRRSKIEDYHSIVFTEAYRFYSVLDGHCGSTAAKYTSRALHVNLELYLKADDTTATTTSIEQAVMQAFAKTQSDFLELYSNATSISGTTATIALVYNDKLIVANVGDSRAVMCSDSTTHSKVIEITTDHTPYIAAERQRIEAHGGKISLKKHGVLRVEGQLAVTRRIGGVVSGSKHILTAVPDVHTYSLNDNADSTNNYQFVILSTDGLWDVVTSIEAVQIVQDVLLNAATHSVKYLQAYGDYSTEQAYQIAATVLTHLAYVRGSADNIGVCVISLK